MDLRQSLVAHLRVQADSSKNSLQHRLPVVFDRGSLLSTELDKDSIPSVESLSSNSLCGTLPKAFFKSKNTAQTYILASKDWCQLSTAVKSAPTVDFPCENPH